MFDILIRDGRIVDGTGNPWFQGTVAIEGDCLKILTGDTSAIQATRIIDASGDYVFVNGTLVAEKGKHTGALNGEPLTMKGNQEGKYERHG